jgi:hypothetical protein
VVPFRALDPALRFSRGPGLFSCARCPARLKAGIAIRRLYGEQSKPSLTSIETMMNFDSLIQYKALDELYKRANGGLLDHFLQDPDTAQQLKLKKLQFDVLPDVHQDVDAVCALLGMSKREFLTAATMQALDKAHEVINKNDIFPSKAA